MAHASWRSMFAALSELGPGQDKMEGGCEESPGLVDLCMVEAAGPHFKRVRSLSRPAPAPVSSGQPRVAPCTLPLGSSTGKAYGSAGTKTVPASLMAMAGKLPLTPSDHGVGPSSACESVSSSSDSLAGDGSGHPNPGDGSGRRGASGRRSAPEVVSSGCESSLGSLVGSCGGASRD